MVHCLREKNEFSLIYLFQWNLVPISDGGGWPRPDGWVIGSAEGVAQKLPPWRLWLGLWLWKSHEICSRIGEEGQKCGRSPQWLFRAAEGMNRFNIIWLVVWIVVCPLGGNFSLVLAKRSANMIAYVMFFQHRIQMNWVEVLVVIMLESSF